VLCLEWPAPLYTAGHWTPEMISLAGGINLLSSPGEKSHRIEWQDVVDSSPDVILWMPCGYDLKQTREAFSAWARDDAPAEFDTLPAVLSGRVFGVDANSYFSRPGPRLATGVELLSELLHGDIGQEIPVPSDGYCSLV